VRTLAAAEIYGGKICAALDRQHPRDLFDIKLLLEDEGLTDTIRKSFIVHLVSHDRPMAELLDPNFADLKTAFTADFEGMTLIKVSPEELEEARARLVKAVREGMTDKERRFILSVKKGDPDWELIEASQYCQDGQGQTQASAEKARRVSWLIRCGRPSQISFEPRAAHNSHPRYKPPG
jgi:hypothetical protein